MPMTGYLKLPDIDGESKRDGHEDEIDISGIQWSIVQPGAATVGRGRTSGRAQASTVSVQKDYDAASPYMALAAMQGKSFDEVCVMVRKDSGEAHLDYLKITMEHVTIADYSMSSGGGVDGSIIEETCSFACEKINILYTVQEDDHSAGGEHEVEFDLVAGA